MTPGIESLNPITLLVALIALYMFLRVTGLLEVISVWTDLSRNNSIRTAKVMEEKNIVNCAETSSKTAKRAGKLYQKEADSVDLHLDPKELDLDLAKLRKKKAKRLKKQKSEVKDLDV